MPQCEAELPLVPTAQDEGGVVVVVGEEGEVLQGREGGGVTCATVASQVVIAI